ncbi:hypothetical protein BUALT_Bualt12G0100100 [Buddleja alternifolia]|uniref:Bet v I/Major latex protein domain-containing protein n=1 Tax=Buddleja alternifolia TaxID=168488 RepID=A0AAV6X0R8_9LAMI|nr:hypothetical protein BUALT_Bualt12G0100100 [Buddleja alternifolia]
MGVKSFFHEVKAKVSPSRLFKALVTDAQNVVPKFSPLSIKSIDISGEGAVHAGCIMQTNFEDGTNMKYKIDAIDTEKNTCKYTLIEGVLLGDKFEKIVFDVKYEASDDGGCVIKQTSEYHTKGDDETIEEEIKQQTIEVFKGCEQYLIANPHVCA